jgi:carboxymethylenebutenolidase
MTSPVTTRWIEIEPGHSGYLALPPAGSGPGLLLFAEAFGVNEHIRMVAEQYALAGFVVLAPDVYWRQAHRVELGYTGTDFDRAIELMKACKPEEQAADGAAAVRSLRGLRQTAGAKVGAIGYCMGGRLAYVAAASAGVDAAVAYYGGGIHGAKNETAQIRCPLLFHFAGHDPIIPPEAVEKVRRALAGRDATIHLYPQAEHGFNCWARSNYHAPSAALALGRSLEFLAALF